MHRRVEQIKDLQDVYHTLDVDDERPLNQLDLNVKTDIKLPFPKAFNIKN